MKGEIKTRTINLLTTHNNLTNEIAKLQDQINSYPDGTLICIQNGKYVKWYHSQNGTYHYIPKTNRQFAEKLAVKKYLSLKLNELIEEQHSINAYFDCHKATGMSCEQLLSVPCYYELLRPFFKSFSDDIQEWANSPYPHNPNYPKNLIYKSISGNTLRSKSEAMIDMCLFQNHIPFRYECQLQLGDITLYPDFTIRHPQTGQFYYWEHYGLIDQVSYQQDHQRKHQLYIENSIIPGINLIETYETKSHPFSPDIADKIIRTTFVE